MLHIKAEREDNRSAPPTLLRLPGPSIDRFGCVDLTPLGHSAQDELRSARAFVGLSDCRSLVVGGTLVEHTTMKRKRLGLAFLYVLFLVCGLSVPTYDADAGPCSRSPTFCERN